jgi:hypothetical protein
MLWQPMALYDWFDLIEIEGQTVTVARHGPDGADNGGGMTPVRLQIGHKAHLLKGAERVLVSVATIGPQLEEQVQQLNATREVMQAYLLDSAGVVALGAIGEAIRCLVEEAAAALGWGLSPSLSPGSLVGWPLWGQRELCSLLPMDAIGVQLNKHCVLEPHKSVSALIGLGPGLSATRVGSVCSYCALQKTCWRRREDPS